MKVLERNENTLIIKLSDGVAIIDIRELIHGYANTIIGHSFHEDFPVTPQPITRYSTTAQMILSFLITGK